jgi:8-oxo-dGTP diphosphatase
MARYPALMPSLDHELAVRYPALFEPARWEWGGFDAQFSTVPPPDELVTNVHVVGFQGDQIVVCRARTREWFLPGGTREVGEGIETCVDRELREEAGARLAGPLRWIGAHYVVSDRPEPYRQHQPHPRAAWLWCAADVAVHGTPTNPPSPGANPMMRRGGDAMTEPPDSVLRRHASGRPLAVPPAR